MPLSLRLLTLNTACLAVTASADTFLRWNQAGYLPNQPKIITVASTDDQSGVPWALRREGAVVLSGVTLPSSTGQGPHTPFAFNHSLDLSELSQPGLYLLTWGTLNPIPIRIDPAAYTDRIHLPLRHLRMMRSGSSEVPHRSFSHRGDARAKVKIPNGDPAQGAWRDDPLGRTVDALGGWYDAGDQIKFTLNQAATAYHLLLAHRLRPDLFASRTASSGLPEVLDEARHGLEFLMRVHPAPDLFIIQVGDAEDHNQPLRLPEHDALDGRRPALCALSRVHMGATSAALAAGARTWRARGDETTAARYLSAARSVFERALQPDTIETAFERDQVNDFYHDPDARDQLALAAMELYEATGDRAYLDNAVGWAPPAATEVGWANWNWLANRALAPHDAGAAIRVRTEVSGYVANATARGAPWGVPGRYVWGSLARWVGIANACRLTALESSTDPESSRVFWNVVDYSFGHNNWGVSFLFDETLPNTLRNLYSPAYKLLKLYPTGAFSAGPGDRSTHAALSRYFSIRADDPFHRFNTEAAVFFDDASDFMCQEATITAQADAVLFLALTSSR